MDFDLRDMDDYLTGRLLVAAPGMGDPRFHQSVVLLCNHDHEHAMGLVLNKPMNKLTLPKLLDQIGIDRAILAPSLPVMDGGPCQRDRGFVLHSDDWHCDDSTLVVCEGIRLTATREILHALTSEEAPARVTMALGYAGWGPGQLESEIRENAWLVCDASPEHVFHRQATASAWAHAVRSLGIDPLHLAGPAGRA